uniref:hypothetical protein n=1 Tax=Staphylococcus aureus TaxID=1280 RepID=UPI00210D128B
MKAEIKGVIVSNEDKWVYEMLGMDSTCPKDVVSETENNSTQKNDLTNPIKKETNTDSHQEAKEAPTTSSTQPQQNNATTS